MEELGFKPSLATKSIPLTTISVSFASSKASVNICRQTEITFLFLSSTLCPQTLLNYVIKVNKKCQLLYKAILSVHCNALKLFWPSIVVCFGAIRTEYLTDTSFERKSIFLVCRETFLKFHRFIKSHRE